MYQPHESNRVETYIQQERMTREDVIEAAKQIEGATQSMRFGSKARDLIELVAEWLGDDGVAVVRKEQ